MRKPLILVMASGWEEHGNPHFRLGAGYMEWLRRCGAIAAMVHYIDDPEYMQAATAHADGVLFTGGPDIDPRHYGQQPIPQHGSIEPRRDSAERALFDAVYPTGKPMLGICKGMQVLNVFLGGSLYQDIDAQYPHKNEGHRQGCASSIPTQTITVAAGTPLHAATGQSTLRVNTFHHQAVRELGPGLKAMAHAGDGIIEAMWHESHPFLWGTQFHPELFTEDSQLSRQIFGAFVAACARG